MCLEKVTLESRSKDSVAGEEPLQNLHITFSKFTDKGALLCIQSPLIIIGNAEVRMWKTSFNLCGT